MKIKIDQFSLSILVIIFCLNSQCQAQNVGYMGKKYAIEFNNGIGVYRPHLFRSQYKPTILTMNYRPELTITRTIGRRVDFGLKVAYHRTKGSLKTNDIYDIKVVGNVGSPLYNGSLSIWSSSDRADYFDPTEEEHIAYSFLYQAYFRFYNQKYIAPVGVYHQVGFGFNQLFFKGNAIKGRLLSFDNWSGLVYNSEPLTFHLRKYYVPTFSYSLGYKKTYASGLYINSALELNLLVPLEINRYKNVNSYVYASSLASELVRAQLFAFKIGVGKIF